MVPLRYHYYEYQGHIPKQCLTTRKYKSSLNQYIEKLDVDKLHINYSFSFLCQVPMFFRLVELIVALYYGALELPEGKTSTTAPAESSVDRDIPG